MRLRPLFFAALVLAAGTLFAQAKPELGNYTPITAKRLRAHLEFVASDLLEGRDTPSRGLDVAAEYIATQMKLFGLEPGGVGKTYFQPFPVKQVRISAARSSLEFGGKKFDVFDGFIPIFSNKSADGGIVYVGHGYRLPGKGIDPYKDLDVKGKLLLRLQMEPKEWNWQDFYLGKQAGSETPELAAARLGATAVLTIEKPSDYDSWTRTAQARKQLVLPLMSDYEFGQGLPAVSISMPLGKALLEGEPASFEQLSERFASSDPGASFALSAAKTVKLTTAIQEETVMTKNVVAVVKGSDPKLSAEYVAVGAHYDHVGMRPDGTGDRIFNGADDDGSGTVALIEMAHALATGPKPKRSVIFVWHAGEEKGLWGSDYFTKNPTVPIKSIVAQLNIDMIGRSKPKGNTNAANKMLTGPNSIYVIGSRRLSNDLGNICASVNKKLFNLGFDYHYDKPNDPESLYERSDHFNYARFGIPIAFFFDGVHEDYHQVGDEAHKIDYRKMEQVTRTVFATAWTIANRPLRPKLDKQS